MSSVNVIGLLVLGVPVFLFTANMLHLLSKAPGASLTLVASLVFSLPGLAACLYYLFGDSSYETLFLGTMFLLLGAVTTLLAVVLYGIGVSDFENWPRYPDMIGLLLVCGGGMLVHTLGLF